MGDTGGKTAQQTLGGGYERAIWEPARGCSPVGLCWPMTGDESGEAPWDQARGPGLELEFILWAVGN